MHNLKEIWATQITSLGVGVVKKKIDGLTHFNCYVGTILASKAKFFSVELPVDLNVNQHFLKRFVGVEIQVLPSNELIILLLENELSDVFTLFIEDIVNSISSIITMDDVVIKISQRVAYWKRLFGKLTGGLLTPQQQRGLYGELEVLRTILSRVKSYGLIIEAWQAPAGSNQDFYFKDAIVEVKTSVSNNPVIKIANEYQLDPTGLPSLYLILIRFIEFPSGENTLLALINSIRELIHGEIDALNDFDSKLISLGVDPDTENEYDKTSYSIRKTIAYTVDENFPKIIAPMVDQSISHISYQISQNECTELEIDYETVINTIINEH